VTYTTLSVTV